MPKITYTNKSNATVSDLPDVNKVTAADMNEIKVSVNQLYNVQLLSDSITLPSSVASPGEIWFYNNQNGGSITLTAQNGETIGNSSFHNLGNNKGVMIYAEGTNWAIILGG